MSRPWMPLYIADFLRDTQRLSTLERGAYISLIMEYWTHGGLPQSDEMLRRITGLTAAEWRKSCAVLQGFFLSGWKHKRLDAELARASEISSKRSASAKSMHAKAAANAPANAPANDPRLDTHARASSQSQLQSQKKERKKDAADARADAPADLEKQFFDRAVEILYGPPNDARKVAGQLRKACGNDIAKARSSLELSAGKSHPKSWIMGHISWLKKKSDEPSDDTVLMNNADDRYVIQ